MRRRALAVTIAAGLAGLVAPLQAHHSVSASHDSSKVVTVTGVIARIDWMNPHTWITLTVTQPNGDVVKERVEIAGPGRLNRIGFNTNLIKFGDLVTIETWMPRNDPRFTGVDPSGRTLILLTAGDLTSPTVGPIVNRASPSV